MQTKSDHSCGHFQLGQTYYKSDLSIGITMRTVWLSSFSGLDSNDGVQEAVQTLHRAYEAAADLRSRDNESVLIRIAAGSYEKLYIRNSFAWEDTGDDGGDTLPNWLMQAASEKIRVP